MLNDKRLKKAETYDEFLPPSHDHYVLYQHHYQRAVVSEDDKAFLDRFDGLNIAVLTEVWCGDSIAIIPVVKKWIEDKAHVHMRILQRDANLDIMDQYLTRGGRAIPKIIFFDSDFRELGNWGPRPEEAQGIYELHRPKIETGEIDKASVHQKIRRFYAKDRGRSIIAEQKQLLETALRE
jgi:hypothetical protein